MYRTFAASPAKAEKGKKKRADKDEEKESSAKESEEKDSEEHAGEHAEGSHDKTDDSGSKDALASSLPDDEEVKHIVPLEPFIVNLADEGDPRYLRVSVNLGIGEGEGGEAEEKSDPLFAAFTAKNCCAPHKRRPKSRTSKRFTSRTLSSNSDPPAR